jgi:hypothetical protein
MRTTRKEFYEKVQNHIAERLSTDETTDRAEQLRQAVEEFEAWWNPYEKHRTPHRQTAFMSFLNCLPSCLSTEFYYDDQRQTLKEWHQQTEEEANKYSDDEVSTHYYSLIYREFCKMCKSAGVDF